MDIKGKSPANFYWAPSLGATASFSSLYDGVVFGDSHKQPIGKGINHLSMSLQLSFDLLTTQESSSMISFLESQFYYEVQSYNNAGKFDNKRITPFDYQPFFPYKKQKFYCKSFNHKKNDFNNHLVNVTFECAHPSIINSVEGNRDYNPIIDSIVSNNTAISSTTANVNFTSKNANTFDLKAGNRIFASGSYNPIKVHSDTTSSPIMVSQKIGSTSSNADFLISNTSDRHSIFIDNPNECSFYPYSKIRFFDFRPSSIIDIKKSPKHLNSSASEISVKYNKYGFNPNLNNVSLKFNNLTDIESKRILLFLESHLGHKKFGFHLSNQYKNPIESDIHRTPHRRNYSHYYCPEWSHTFVYKNNNSITASFIECLDY